MASSGARNLVEIARRTALRFGAARATFVHASVDTFAFDGFNGIYLYNPFYEQISDFLVQIDNEIRPVPARVQALRARNNDQAPPSAARPMAVVTFHGFGAPCPPNTPSWAMSRPGMTSWSFG